MRNSWYKKAIVLSIIVLFLGVSIQPSMGAEIPDKIEVEPKDNLIQKIKEITNSPDFKNIHSIPERLLINNPVIEKVITTFIERIEQLSDLPCDCENDDTTLWFFPVLCAFLIIPFYIGFLLALHPYIRDDTLLLIIIDIATALNCYWG